MTDSKWHKVQEPMRRESTLFASEQDLPYALNAGAITDKRAVLQMPQELAYSGHRCNRRRRTELAVQPILEPQANEHLPHPTTAIPSSMTSVFLSFGKPVSLWSGGPDAGSKDVSP